MTNRLSAESSPYLLQHQNNPVDWYPWGAEALARAKAEEKPIFLSIGYSACHWCHVMEHESFENEQIAAELNRLFVCIKVDREERPDLDQIYMNAVQLMTGRGGWPMSLFLTPELTPFFGGTYWPPAARMGMPGFLDVVRAVADAWQNRRELAVQQAAEMTQHLQKIGNRAASEDPLELALIEHAAAQLQQAFDPKYGGFGRAPKFPHSIDLQVLLRVWSRNRDPQLLQIVTHTLEQMANGGIYDHLAGGFARYSVDERWLVPHFEKMLYDNALLTTALLETYQATGNEFFARIARETCDYILGWMTDPAGGFHSTEDADSEGEEGKFYVWTPSEIAAVLGEERGRVFCKVYDVTAAGNFEHGHSIPNLPKPLPQLAKEIGIPQTELERELEACRQELLHVREQRIRPGKDDKIIVSWNSLMIDAFARAAVVLNEPRYLQAAEKASLFLHQQLRDANGKLLHTWRHGRAKLAAYLDDYAYLANAWVSMYEANFDAVWLERASELAETMLKHFADPTGGFYFTADDHEQLIIRNVDLHDSSVPSGNAMAATALIRLGKITGKQEYLQAAEQTLQTAVDVMQRSPTAAGQLLLALDLFLGPTTELVFLGDRTTPETKSLLADLRRQFLPRQVFVAHQPGDTVPAVLQPLLEGKSKAAANNEPQLFVCQNFACQAPARGAAAIRQLWQQISQ